VIFIGAVLDWAEVVLELGAAAGFAPHAAVSTTADHPAPITARRAAMFIIMMILEVQSEPKLNASRSRVSIINPIDQSMPCGRLR
jgi:hypothetical protein